MQGVKDRMTFTASEGRNALKRPMECGIPVNGSNVG
jgi:hypothetical protein